MSSPKWTKEQQSVIDSRGGNLLVAAAAGSGKTAVLVERIIQMILNPDVLVGGIDYGNKSSSTSSI